MEDVVIVGTGCAGLTATLRTARSSESEMATEMLLWFRATVCSVKFKVF